MRLSDCSRRPWSSMTGKLRHGGRVRRSRPTRTSCYEGPEGRARDRGAGSDSTARYFSSTTGVMTSAATSAIANQRGASSARAGRAAVAGRPGTTEPCAGPRSQHAGAARASRRSRDSRAHVSQHVGGRAHHGAGWAFVRDAMEAGARGGGLRAQARSERALGERDPRGRAALSPGCQLLARHRDRMSSSELIRWSMSSAAFVEVDLDPPDAAGECSLSYPWSSLTWVALSRAKVQCLVRGEEHWERCSRRAPRRPCRRPRTASRRRPWLSRRRRRRTPCESDARRRGRAAPRRP